MESDGSHAVLSSSLLFLVLSRPLIRRMRRETVHVQRVFCSLCTGNWIEQNRAKGVDSFQKEKELLLFSISFYVQVEEEEYSVGVHLSVGTTRRRAGDAQRSPVAHTHKSSASFLLFFLFFFFCVHFLFFLLKLLFVGAQCACYSALCFFGDFTCFPGSDRVEGENHIWDVNIAPLSQSKTNFFFFFFKFFFFFLFPCVVVEGVLTHMQYHLRYSVLCVPQFTQLFSSSSYS